MPSGGRRRQRSGGLSAEPVEQQANEALPSRADAETFVRELGAKETIGYTAGSVVEMVNRLYPDGITSLIDVVSQADALTDLGSIVQSGGRIASLLGAADVEHFAARNVTATNVNAAPTIEKLERLADLAVSGELRILIQGVYSIDQVGEALEAFRDGKRGKLIVRM